MQVLASTWPVSSVCARSAGLSDDSLVTAVAGTTGVRAGLTGCAGLSTGGCGSTGGLSTGFSTGVLSTGLSTGVLTGVLSTGVFSTGDDGFSTVSGGFS